MRDGGCNTTGKHNRADPAPRDNLRDTRIQRVALTTMVIRRGRQTADQLQPSNLLTRRSFGPRAIDDDAPGRLPSEGVA
jgi:hypothetical protein